MLYTSTIWKFKVFVEDNGKNVIVDWLQKLPQSAQDAIDTRIRYLEVTEKWQRPAFDKLKGYDGIHEIRVKDHLANIEYRIFGCYGPGRKEFTLLVGAYKKDKNYDPKNCFNTAGLRYKNFQKNKGNVYDYE